MSVVYFKPLDVHRLSDWEIIAELKDIAENFPHSGSNYAVDILLEAALRIESTERSEEKK